jgi:SsrA-binding protein
MTLMESLLYNKKAGFDYEIMEKFQAGIVLVGFEVKSIREKKGNLIGAHVSVRGDEAFLLNSFIPPYQEKNTPTSYDPYHVRKLLLTKKEITDLRKSESQKGLTIIPI